MSLDYIWTALMDFTGTVLYCPCNSVRSVCILSLWFISLFLQGLLPKYDYQATLYPNSNRCIVKVNPY